MNNEEKMFMPVRRDRREKDKRYSRNGAKNAMVIECKVRYGDDREKIHHGDPEDTEEE
ncbi:MAG TPA: hypothetical protein P5295_03325 [Spirochaetota bacterium]|nr:hypothetical protein [Spirochaetota bacterium]